MNVKSHDIEVRYDPIVPRRVSVISRVRKFRPKELTLIRHEATYITQCPFCPGNEYMTPPATLVVKIEGDVVRYYSEVNDLRISDWLVRIFPNKYPIFSPYVASSGYGYHEVVVETPNHNAKPYMISDYELALVFKAVLMRINEMFKDPKIRHAILIKNYGGGGGCSLAHPHMQLMGTSFILPNILEEITYSVRYYRKRAECPYCRLVNDEVRSPRVIYSNSDFIVVTAYAPKQPYESWVIPIKHSAAPLGLSDGELLNLANALRQLLLAYSRCVGDVDYNLWLHMAPKSGLGPEYHWHLEIQPVISIWGGLEKGGGAYVVTVSPEEAASELRKVI